MKRKIINALSVLTLAFIPFVASCSNSNTVNNNTIFDVTTGSIPTSPDNIPTSPDNIPTSTDNIPTSTDNIPMSSFGGDGSFLASYSSNGELKNEEISKDLNIDLFFGIEEFYSAKGVYNSSDKKWVNSDTTYSVPYFYSDFIEMVTPNEKEYEYLENKTPYELWENNYCDFNQEINFNIYREVYNTNCKTLNFYDVYDLIPVKRDLIYSSTKCLGYYFSSDFIFDKTKNMISDVIAFDDLITDKDGNCFIRYYFELIPKEDDYIKLVAKTYHDIYVDDRSKPILITYEDGTVRKDYEKYIVKSGDLINPYICGSPNNPIIIGGIDKFYFGFNIGLKKNIK